MKTLKTKGIHHITSIVGDPEENIRFYREVMGLRLVKKTVNFDDPYTYHLYFGDEEGRPGTVITFFPWDNGQKGRIGNGQVGATMYRVPVGSLGYWKERIQNEGCDVKQLQQFGQERLLFSDPHGLKLIFVEGKGEGRQRFSGIPKEYRILGFEGAVLYSQFPEETKDMLVNLFHYRVTEENPNTIRLSTDAGEDPGSVLEIDRSERERGLTQVGTVHHMALRIDDRHTQSSFREALLNKGFSVSPIRDRNYFTSIYFREPGGVLFEVATDGPGFLRDESFENLGEELKLPREYESRRGEIEEHLPVIQQGVN